MSVANVAVKQRYQGDGVTTTFAIPFAFIPGNGASVTKVYKITYDASLVPTEVLQVIGSSNDYTLAPDYNPATGIDNSSVVFNAAPSASTQILVIRAMNLNQLISLLNTGPTFYKTVENGLDILTFLVQQLDEKIKRAPKFRVSGVDNDVPLPDMPTSGGPYLFIIDTAGKIKFGSPQDLGLPVAYNGQDVFSVSMNTVSQILTGYSFDGAKYSSIVVEYEVTQGNTVFTNGAFALQYLNGTWQKVNRGEFDNGTPMGITFPIQQTLTVVQLLATETGVGDAKIKLKRLYFLQS